MVMVDAHAALVDKVVQADTTKERNRHALAYLLRYESMVRQQEAEDMAVGEHLRPILERIRALNGEESKEDDEDWWTSLILYADLKKALVAVEQSHGQPSLDFWTTDKQVVLVLRHLTQHIDDDDKDASITVVEFIQCYKCCIAGMTTLMHVPRHETSIRMRVRERTLSLLSLFEPSPTKLFANEEIDTAALEAHRHPPSPVKQGGKQRRWKIFLSVLPLIACALMVYDRVTPRFFLQQGTGEVDVLDLDELHPQTTVSAPFSVKSRLLRPSTQPTLRAPAPPFMSPKSSEPTPSTSTALVVASSVMGGMVGVACTSFLSLLANGQLASLVASSIAHMGSGTALLAVTGLLSLSSMLLNSMWTLLHRLRGKAI